MRLQLFGLVAIVIIVITISVGTEQSLRRTPDGHPDLQGKYDLATLTPLERPLGAKAVMSEEEAANLEKDVANRTRLLALPSGPDRGHRSVETDRQALRGMLVAITRSGWIEARAIRPSTERSVRQSLSTRQTDALHLEPRRRVNEMQHVERP
jgi:hypothetical protein